MSVELVLGIGNPFCDQVAPVKEEFLTKWRLKKGDTSPTFELSEIEDSWKAVESKKEEHLGGSCTNVMKALARMGKKCGQLGMIGNDTTGQWIQKRFQEIGLQDFLKKAEAPTGKVNCFLTPNERTMQAFFGSSFHFSVKDLEETFFEKAKHVHLEGYLAYFEGVLEKSISYVKPGVTTSLDLSSSILIKDKKDLLETCAKKVDILFGNLQEMQELTGKTKIEDVVKNFRSNQIVFITNGELGGWVKGKEKSEPSPFNALKVERVVSTLGAGDFFLAGALCGILDEKSEAQCVEMGNTAASYVLTETGAELPEDKWKMLVEKMQKI